MANYYLNDDGSITKKKQNIQQTTFAANVKTTNKTNDYNSYATKRLQQERTKLVKEMNQYSGTTNSKGKYSLKSIYEAMSGKTRKKLEKDEKYQEYQKRLNEMDTILKQRYNDKVNKEGNFADRTANSIANQLETYAYAGEEVRKNPIQSVKTGGVGFLEGAQNSVRAIENSALDLGKAIFGNNEIYNDWYTRQKIEMQMREIGDPLKKTKTYKQKESGKLSEGQQLVYGAGENLGQMAPSVALSTVTGSPTLGSAAFYAQAQDNYYNEAKQRGYDEKQARAYSLMMAGVELGVERLGFDQLSGLGEGSIVKAMFGEAAEEAVTPYIDSGLRQVAFKERIDWNETNEEAISGAFLAMMTAGMTQMAGNGFAKIDNLVNKINTGEKITSNDLSEAFQEVQQADPGYAETMISEAVDSLDKDTINQIKNQMNLNDNQTQEIKTQDNISSLQEQQSTNIEQPSQEQMEQPKTQEQPQIIPSTEKKKEGQLQFNLKDTKLDMPNVENKKQLFNTLTKNSTSKETANTAAILSEPQKNKVTTTLEDGTKFINPSENKDASIEDITKMVNDTVTQKDTNEAKVLNKGRREAYENMKAKYLKEGNTEMADSIQYLLDNDLYDTYHVNLEQAYEQKTMYEDPEYFFKKFYELYEKGKEKGDFTQQQILELQNKATVLQKFYGNIELKTYNANIATIVDRIFAEIGTPTGQILNARRNYYGADPSKVATNLIRDKYSAFHEESKEHLDDPLWLKDNNPMNPKSKYYTTPEDYSAVNKLGQELSKIKDKNSSEYIKKSAQLNKAIQNSYKGKSLTTKFKSLTLTNVLASTRIWIQNSKGNFVNLGQYEVLDNIPAIIADKIMSKSTEMRSRGISFRGDVLEGTKAFAKGVYDSYYELKNDVSLSHLGNRFKNEMNIDTKQQKIGNTFNDKNKVGWLLNRYERLVNFALDLGDRPYAMFYFEKSIYNQRMLNAQIQAQKQNVDMIYKETYNDKTKTHSIFYYDSEGRVHSGEIMTQEQYDTFKKTAKTQELTEDMIKIAEEEALENTYQNDNTITKAAVGLKNNLNKIAHIGDYGLGDVFLKFTRTGSNMARALVEHSPLEAIKFTNDLIRYEKNKKNGTPTLQLQHKVATDFGKLVGGALVYVPIAAMTWGGMGPSRKDEDDKQSKFKNVSLGAKEYSVKLPFSDYTYKISNDSTVGSLTRMGVDVGSLINETGSLIDTFLGTADSFTNSLIDMSFMSSVLEMGNSYKNPIDNIAKKIASQPSNLIPSWFKDISYTMDAFTKRNVYDENVFQYALNQVIDKTPFRKNGLTIGNVKVEGLTPKRNSWGEVQKVGADIISSAWNTWALGDTFSKVNDDPIANEAMKIYMSTNNTAALPKLSITDKSFKYNKKEIKLNKQQQDDYMRVYGNIAYDSVKKLMNTNQYKNGDDEYKLALLKQAYSYADEKARENRIKSTDMLFLNYKEKDNKFTEYKKPVFEEILENDISIKEAQYKRNNPNPYKLRTSITDWDNYNNIKQDIKNIKETYSKDNGFTSKQQKYAVQSYINNLQGLSDTKKAMIAKVEGHKSYYSNYDNKILQYIKTLNLTQEEYKYVYEQLGLGGYWSVYYKSK